MTSHRQTNTHDAPGQHPVTRHRGWLRRTALLTAAALAATFGLVGVGPGVAQAAVAGVPLGAASSYGALTPAGAFASTLATTFRGDIGATTISVLAPGTHIGTKFVAASSAAIADMTAAYANAEGRTGGAPIIPQIGGLTVGPGVHSIGQAIVATAGQAFTMDGQNDPNAVFIFQVGAALGIGANFTMNLTGGARAQNVFWQVNGAASIGADSNFVGTILANGAISMGANTNLNGRMLTKTGAISVSNMQLYSGPPLVEITSGASFITDTPLITGKAPSPVTVEIKQGATVVKTYQVTPVAGVWSVQVAAPGLASGSYNVVASASDGGGNTGTAEKALTIDTQAPTITINGGATAATSDTSPTVSGTTDVDAGQPVKVTFTKPISGGVKTETRTVSVQTGGTWNTTLTLGEGIWTVVAEVTDPAGNKKSVTQVLTIDVDAPAISITTKDLTNDSTPTISGTREAGATVKVFIDGLSVTPVIVTGTTWTVTSTKALLGGDHNVSVTVTDNTGNETTLAQTLTIDLVKPIIAINGGATGTTSDRTPTIVGTTDVAMGLGISVAVTIDGGTPMVAVIQASGWNVTPFTQLANGKHKIVATVKDPAGNTGTFTQTLTVDSSTVLVTVGNGDPVVSTNDTTPVIQGGGSTPGYTVTVVIDGQTLTTVVRADGTWSVTPPKALPQGDNLATITITDEFGNTGTATQIIRVGSGTATSLNAVGPVRVFDTRAGQSPNALRSVSKNQVGTFYELRVKMTGITGFVPKSGVGAVSLNVASTGSGAAGFITVYDCGKRETVANVNFLAGRTVGNSVITPVSSTGDVCFYASTSTDIIVELNGWFATGSGFNAVSPKRVFDTRSGESPDALRTVTKAKLGVDRMMEVKLTSLAGFVPGSGVGAVSLNIAVDQPDVAGFITVYACDSRTLVSSLNYLGGQTVSNAVIAPVSPNGTVCFYSSATTHLIVDINGWFATGSAFTSVGPERVFDTRPGESPDVLRNVTKKKLGAFQTMEVQFTGIAGLPSSGVGAVSLNIAVSQPLGSGFITAYACGSRPGVASLNFAVSETVGNAVIVPVSSNGTLCFYSTATTNLIVDINGWFAG